MPSSAEEAIRKAMEEGHFDNLPGKGKPLKLDENPFEDPEWRLANKILRDGGFTLPWIEVRREIDLALQGAREALGRSWAWRQSALAQNQPPDFVDAEWRRSVETFREAAAALNRRIRSYNLQVPSARFQLPLVNAEREIAAVRESNLSARQI